MTTHCYEHLVTDRQGQILVVTLAEKEICEGELAESIQRELSHVVQTSGVRQVVIDLHVVEFISSVGFGPLFRLRTALTEAGGAVALCRCSDFVKTVFVTAHLIDPPCGDGSMFPYTETVAEAVQVLSDDE